VGANNRLPGKVVRLEAGFAEIDVGGGWQARARCHGAVSAGSTAEAFVRPEAMTLARTSAELPAGQPAHSGEVISLLFDGANSVVLLRETLSGTQLRVALPQTGAFADLTPGARIAFSFDANRAICFGPPATHV
jgi:spermidine/putrescine transport system ATP-binding protein